jgi:SAM-dependent methyltransferase
MLTPERMGGWKLALWRGYGGRRMGRTSYVRDWSAVSPDRYREAQEAERAYWRAEDPRWLYVNAAYQFYAGYYQWHEHRDLHDPFRVNPASPRNFQIPAEEMEGRRVLDVGCGPQTHSLSLVHCAEVHAVDPLADFHRELQPFGWEHFGSVTAAGAEELPFEDGTFDFVHCWNVLDHVRDAGRVLGEIGRVLAPDGQLLLGCDVRPRRGGGSPHPYHWTREALEERLLAEWEPVTPIQLLDELRNPIAPGQDLDLIMWSARLRRRASARPSR